MHKCESVTDFGSPYLLFLLLLLFAAGVAARDLGAGFILASGSGVFGSGVFGWSPSKRLSGQILNAGHFWQPATMAIGQIVMGNPVWSGGKKAQYAPGAYRKVVCFT